ncbi:hypothetical protein KJ781_03400, partial [Patescibacteria group bacterium]|nr:hypothetical protein [Patescibacteria group bacterium]MBU1448874.1 hypothetical protein [Patescibacteria group bacterium]
MLTNIRYYPIFRARKPMTRTLTAASRTDLGRQATKVRNAGRIPAIVYGHGIEPK